MRLFIWTLVAIVQASVVDASPALAEVCTIDYGTCISFTSDILR